MNKNIRNHQSALDINEIWAAIEPQVDIINAQRKKRKRKPAFIYWLTGAILLIGLISTGLFLFGEHIQHNETSIEQLPKQNNSIAVPAVTSEKTDEVVNQEAILSMTEKEAPKQATSTTVNRVSEEKSNVEKAITIEKKPAIILPSAPASTKSISVVTEDLITTTQPSNVIQPKEKVTPASANLASKNIMASLTELPIRKVGLNAPSTALPELNFSIKNNKSLLPPPIYVERPTLSIEFQTGISATVRTLSSTGDRELDTLLNLRNTFEQSLEALHANLLVNAHFPSGFYVSSGVAFTQISEVYNNNSTQSEIITDSMGIQKRIINLIGDTIDVIGPVETTVTTTFTKKFYNTYRMIDIPIFVGYQYDFGDWKTDFSLGVFANILLATDGRIPNTPTTDLDLSTNGDDIYRSRVDYSLQFGIGISRSLTDKLSLRVNPMFRYYSKNFIKEDVGLSQRYLLFGGTIGLRMDL